MKILLPILLLFLSSCSWFSDSGTPFMSGTTVQVPRGTPVFKQGWKDGCGTATHARGNSLYKFIHTHRYDTKLIDNPEYRFGYSRGYTACFQYAVAPDSGPNASFDRYILPYGNNSVFDMTGGSVNKAWHGFFGPASGIWSGDVTNSKVTFDSIVNIWQNAEGGGGTALGSDPIWAGGSKGQIFGQ